MDNPIDIVNLVLNGGSTAVMLFLYVRLETRYEALQNRILDVLEQLADLQETVQNAR